MKYAGCLIMVFVLSAIVASGQRYYGHNIIWGRLALSDSLGKNLKWELFIQHRRQNTAQNDLNVMDASQFTSYWLWLHRQVSPSIKVSVSPFGYFKSWILIAHPTDIDKEGIREIRWSARADHEVKGRFMTMINRHNLEYRLRDLANNGVFQPNWRIRYMLRFEKAVNFPGHEKPLSLVAYDEVFIQFGKAVKNNPNIFDQNRIYLGLSYPFSKNVRGSLGYIYGVQQRNSGSEIDFSNILWAVLTLDNLFSPLRRK